MRCLLITDLKIKILISIYTLKLEIELVFSHSTLIFLSLSLQDGSYSRGPVDIPVGDIDDSKYYLSPTFKFEQVSFNAFILLESILTY